MFVRYKPSALNAHRVADADGWHRARRRCAGCATAADRLDRCLYSGLAHSVVIASSIAWWLWSIVRLRLPTAVASLSSLGVSIVSALLAWSILHEQPSLMEWLGIAFVVAGLVAVSGLGICHRGESSH